MQRKAKMISSIVFSSNIGQEIGEVTFFRLGNDEIDFDDDTNSVVEDEEWSRGATIEMTSSLTLPYSRLAMLSMLKGSLEFFGITDMVTFKVTFYRDASAAQPSRWSVMLGHKCFWNGFSRYELRPEVEEQYLEREIKTQLADAIINQDFLAWLGLGGIHHLKPDTVLLLLEKILLSREIDAE